MTASQFLDAARWTAWEENHILVFPGISFKTFAGLRYAKICCLNKRWHEIFHKAFFNQPLNDTSKTKHRHTSSNKPVNMLYDLTCKLLRVCLRTTHEDAATFVAVRRSSAACFNASSSADGPSGLPLQPCQSQSKLICFLSSRHTYTQLF